MFMFYVQLCCIFIKKNEKEKILMFYPQYPAVHTQIMLTQKKEKKEGNCFQFILCLLFN